VVPEVGDDDPAPRGESAGREEGWCRGPTRPQHERSGEHGDEPERGNHPEDVRWTTDEGRWRAGSRRRGFGYRSSVRSNLRHLSERSGQRSRFRGRRGLVFGCQTAGEPLVNLKRLRPVAPVIEEPHEPPRAGFLVGLEVAGGPGRLHRPKEIPGLLGAVGDRHGGGACRLVQSGPGLGDPFLELDAHLGEVHAVQEGIPVQGERLAGPVVRHRGLEGQCVAPEAALAETDLIVRAGFDRPLTNRAAQMMQCLAEGATALLLAQLRPEKCKKCIPAVKAPRLCQREVHQQCETFWLDRDEPHGRRIALEQFE
jgi:hypothetical protein